MDLTGVNTISFRCQLIRLGLPIQNSWQRKTFELDSRGLPLSPPAPSLRVVQKVKKRSHRPFVTEDLGLAFRPRDPSRVSGGSISIVLSDCDSQSGAIPPLLFAGKYKDQTSYLDEAEYLKRIQ